MPPEDQSDWEHVARLLRDRRTELEPRYKNKQLFSEERGINRRMLWLVESGKPANYQTNTRQVIEKAYGLVPGSFDRLRVGGDLERLSASPERGQAPRSLLTEVPPGGLDDALIERMAANIIATCDPLDRPVMEALWASAHVPAKVRLEMMLDYPRYDSRLPVDYDKHDDDGEGDQERA